MKHNPKFYCCRPHHINARRCGGRLLIATVLGLVLNGTGFAATAGAKNVSHTVASSLPGCIRTIDALDPGFPAATQLRALNRGASGELTAQIMVDGGALIIACHGRNKTMDITRVDTLTYDHLRDETCSREADFVDPFVMLTEGIAKSQFDPFTFPTDMLNSL